MGITRSQYIQGNTADGVILSGTVQGVTAGAGVSIAADGSLSITQSTTTQIGGALLATVLEAETGTDFLKIITPSTLRATAVYKSDFNAKGDILTATANDSPQTLAVGSNGQYLQANPATATGLAWATLPALPKITMIDDIAGLFNGVLTSFPLRILGTSYSPSPSTNLMVFLGGVPQIPGISQAYTVSGSTITFFSAPVTGMSFYATTVV
jgi:hypothetical protein